MFMQTFRSSQGLRASKGARSAGKSLVALSAVAATLASVPVSATILFQEDFESYAVGSNITGQGGWVPDDITYSSAINVGNGAYLPTKVLNGLSATNYQMNLTTHLLGAGLSPDKVTTLTFDAYAVNTSIFHTHNAVIGLGNSSTPNFPALGPYWQAERVGFGPSYQWWFNATQLTGVSGQSFGIVGGYNTLVTMSIVIDGVANEVYGIYDFGSGPSETPHYAVTDAQIAQLNQVGVEFDYRYFLAGYGGPELDNLVVAETGPSVPEPTTALLLAVSLPMLGLVVRRRR